MFNFFKNIFSEKKEKYKKIIVDIDGNYKIEGYVNLSRFINEIAHNRDYRIDFDLYNRTARVVFAQDYNSGKGSKKKNNNKENK